MLILIGFFCAGKTTYGRQLAAEKRLPFVDTDALIEARYQQHVGEVYRALGEQAFRALELETLKSITFPDAVVSTGGGTPMTEENRAYLKTMGEIIHLHVPFETLYARIINRRFPPFADKSDPYASCKQTYEMRLPIYTSLADRVVA